MAQNRRCYCIYKHFINRAGAAEWQCACSFILQHQTGLPDAVTSIFFIFNTVDLNLPGFIRSQQIAGTVYRGQRPLFPFSAVECQQIDACYFTFLLQQLV
jgi:hypothetical protein